MEALLDHPAALVGLLAVVIALLVVLKRVRESQEARAKEAFPGLDKLLTEGRYDEAARLALQHERPDDAIELYLRAQSPGRAAQVAARKGDHRLAGELYERAGDRERAAASYERAGMTARARELNPAGATSSPPVAPGSNRPTPRATSGAPPQPLAPVESPEARFRRLLAAKPADDAGRVELQQSALAAAESALAAGELRRAADIYREAGLFDEAVHLLVNVLGQPGEAAPLLAARGHHDRAAELYELAGQKERAAATWAEVARTSGHVERYVDRIERLDRGLAVKVVAEALGSAAPRRENAELHYRYGQMLEALGERVKALEVFSALVPVMGSWRDLPSRVRALGGGRGNDKPTMPETPAPSLEPGAPHTRRPSTPKPRPRGDEPAGPSEVTAVLDERVPELLTDDIKAIAAEAARAAVDRIRRSSLPPPSGDGAAVVARAQRNPLPPTRVVAVTLAEPLTATPGVGLEAVPVAIELLHDDAVKAAREGVSVDTLRAWVGDKPCDLGNIEVYYRLGLALLAGGSWAEARKCFDAVEEASPGYRDAAERSENIARWESALGGRVTVRGGGPDASASAPPRYRIKGELGRGGMAVVYRAEDTVLGRDVALKFLAETALERTEFQEMFQREARAVAQLNHPNIVTIYDVGELDGRAFIAMEFVEGETVDEIISREGKLAVVEALRVAMQCLSALEVAHARHIIHRDVKPSNLMRASSGLVKLMDFGLARSIAQSAKSSVVAGTPAYMPPEQFVGDHVDHRADLFALAASLYEMITGALPFDGMARAGRPPSMKKHVPAVPTVVDEVVLTALDPAPDKRFASAAAMAAPLRRVLAAVDQVTGAVPELARSNPPDPPATSATNPPQKATVDLTGRRADAVSAVAPTDAPPPMPAPVTEAEPLTLPVPDPAPAAEAAPEPSPAPTPPSFQATQLGVGGGDGFIDFDAPARPPIAPVDPRDLVDDEDA